MPGYTATPLVGVIDTMHFGPSHAARLLQATDAATYSLTAAAGRWLGAGGLSAFCFHKTGSRSRGGSGPRIVTCC